MSSTTLSIRFLVVGGIVLAMLIPLLLVGGVAGERQRYFEAAAAAVAQSWGGDQCVRGPFLVIPIEERDGAGERRVHRVLLPDALDVVGDLQHDYRQRSIYEVPVYETALRLTGSFAIPEREALAGPDDRVRVDEARLVLGVADTRSITGADGGTWAGQPLVLRAGTGAAWLGTGVQARLPAVTPGASADFELAFTLRGTRNFAVAPLGNRATVALESSWPSPSFHGRFLPDRHDVSAHGFSAAWSVHELARSVPASWIAERDAPHLGNDAAAVALHDPVSGYHVIERGIKYGVLFVALTYLTFVCFELVTPIRFHYVQYGVVGLGLSLFYLTLLSLSEHLPFGVAYLLATALLTGQIAWYVWLMSRSRLLALTVLGIVSVLYQVLYVVLKLEAYALLAGTGVLIVGLAALMYTTRRLTALADDAEGAAQPA